MASNQVWTPVEVGSLALVLKGLERYQRQIGRAELQGWYTTSVARNEIAHIEEMMQALRGTDDQPPTLAICQLVDAPAAVTIPSEVREAAMRASAWLVDMLNDYRGDGMDDLRADVITWRQWLDAQPADDA